MRTRLVGRDLTLERLGAGLEEGAEEPVVSQPALVNNLGLTMTIAASGTGWNIAISGNADYTGSYFVENSALLGGLRINVGDDVIEGDVATRLQRAAQNLPR